MVKRTESGTTYTQNFDTENRITSIVTGSQTTTFVYDGDGALVKKIRPDNTYTLYIGGIYELDLNASNAVTKKTSYYPGGAMRVDIVGVSNTLYYLLKDHLSSASVVLDNSGALIANGEQRYYPYGEKRITTAALPTDRLYTGQLELASLGGIYNYGARFYSPRLGRFLSADSIVPNWTNPQSLNRFTYTLNNPLRYTDPTGHVPSYCQQYPAECQAELGGGAPIYHPPAPPVQPPVNIGNGGCNDPSCSGTPSGQSPQNDGDDGSENTSSNTDSVGVEGNLTGNMGSEVVIPFVASTYHIGQRYSVTGTLGHADLVGGVIFEGYYSTYTPGLYSLSQGTSNGLPWIRLAYLSGNGYSYVEIGVGESDWLHSKLPYAETGIGSVVSTSGGGATGSLAVESYVRSQVHEGGAIIGGAMLVGVVYLVAGPEAGHAVACRLSPQQC